MREQRREQVLRKFKFFCHLGLTCGRGLAELTGGGAWCGGRFLQLQLSLQGKLWNGLGKLLPPRAPGQAGAPPTSS